MTIKALDVARYILTLVDVDKGDIISNLKLQKILYYIQGYHLAYFNKPLFNDKIEAWKYGPVVVNVYHEYKDYDREQLPTNNYNFDISKLSQEQKNLIINVFNTYNNFSAPKLVEMTHDELPWKESYSPDISKEISIETMKKYFKTQVDND